MEILFQIGCRFHFIKDVVKCFVVAILNYTNHLSPPFSLSLSPPPPCEQAAIANARSLEEVQQLEAMLKAGQIPGQQNHMVEGQGDAVMEEEEMA